MATIYIVRIPATDVSDVREARAALRQLRKTFGYYWRRIAWLARRGRDGECIIERDAVHCFVVAGRGATWAAAVASAMASGAGFRSPESGQPIADEDDS